MKTFIEVVLVQISKEINSQSWIEQSTTDYFYFSSNVGFLRLQRRRNYPETFAYIQGDYLYFGYGAEKSGAVVTNQQLSDVSEASFHGEEFLFGRIDCRDGECVIQRDGMCTVPIFIGVQEQRFVFSNKYERAYELLDTKKLHLNEHGLAALMLGDSTSGIPLVKEIDILTDRSRGIWSHGSYNKQLPPHSGLKDISKQAESNPQEFPARYEETLNVYWQRYATGNVVGAELSCGFDSSAICAYYSTQGQTLHMVTLTYHDKYRASVVQRLATLKQRFGIVSHLIAMDPQYDYPFKEMVQEGIWQASYHGDTMYTAPLERLVASMKQQGVTVAFQGIGGDELFDNIPLYAENPGRPLFLQGISVPKYVTEKFQDFAETLFTTYCPVTVVPLLAQSVITSKVGGNNLYLDQDIWPVTPLADPRLYLYCQGLPIQYRANRNIMKAYLHAKEFPEAVYNPIRNEDLELFFSESMRNTESFFRYLMRQSILADMGLINPRLAIKMWENATLESQTGENQDPYSLYCLMLAEINLRILSTTTQRFSTEYGKIQSWLAGS